MSSSANTPPTRAQTIAPDSPGIHGRSSYIYSDTVRTHQNSLDITEKYDAKDHARHLELANQASSDDDLDHITEFPNKWAKTQMKTILLIASLFMLQALVYASAITNGEYIFECHKTDHLLSIEGDSKYPNAYVVIAKDQNKAGQKFKVVNVGYDYISIISKNSNLAITAAGTYPGSKLQQKAIDNKDEKQLFTLHKTHDHFYQIKNKASGLLIRCDGKEQNKYYQKYAILGKKTCEPATKFSISKVHYGPPKLGAPLEEDGFEIANYDEVQFVDDQVAEIPADDE